MTLKNRVYALIAGLMFCVTAGAQMMNAEKYPVIPDDFNGAFIDLVKEYPANVVKSAYGQYYGQLTIGGDIYGYGTFYTDADGIIMGQFRNGRCIFGIKMGSQTVEVGTETHYIKYDLSTGDPIYIIKDSLKYLPSADFIKKYRFESLTYQNGDRYVGETVDGKREGYGAYYYTNGNYYYGQYRNNLRHGYGAMFRTENRITLQYWEDNKVDGAFN